MSWFEAAPVALVSVAWLLLPGLPVTYALGLRGIAAWALAPVATVFLVASTAAGAELVGMSWSVWLPVAVCAAVAVLVGVGAVLLRRRWRVVREADPWPVTTAAAAGLLPALVLGALTAVRGFGHPDALSQTFDAVFHYNATAFILDSHQASALTIGALGNPDVQASFYPAAWHDLASLVVMSTGAGIPVTANMLSGAIAVVVWPLSCLLLVRQLFGRSPAALAVTSVLSIGFTAFPWGLLGFGVLWPNSLGLAMAPAMLAVVVGLVGLARDDALGKGRCALMLPAVLIAAGFSHPNVLFGVLLLSVFAAGSALLARAWRLHKAGRTWRGVAEVLGVLVILGAGWYWAATTPAFARVRSQYWAPFETTSRAVGEVLLNATNGGNALWILSIAVLVGVVASLRQAHLRWLVAGHAAIGVLYLLTASINRPDTQKFTGYWYNDSFRLAAMLPITGVPLAVAGILFATKKIADRVAAVREADGGAARPAWLVRVAGSRLAASGTAVAVVLTLLVVGATKGLYPDDRAARVNVSYAVPAEYSLATPRSIAFLERVERRVPPDAVVAGNPWDGSVLVWAIADRRTLFPHFDLVLSPEQTYLAKHLTEAVADPAVCRAVHRLHVQYLLIGNANFWAGDPRREAFPGLADPYTRPGFELVESDGAWKLYRISACGTASTSVASSN